MIKGCTFAPAFQEKRALQHWFVEKTQGRLKKRIKNFRKSLEVINKASIFAPAFETEAASSLKY